MRELRVSYLQNYEQKLDVHRLLAVTRPHVCMPPPPPPYVSMTVGILALEVLRMLEPMALHLNDIRGKLHSY